MSHLIKRLKGDSAPSPYRLWYNKWVSKNAKGKVLDVGKSVYWDYGFPTLDINPQLNPTYVGDIENTNFKNGEFDIVLCNGLYEWVDKPQDMIDEVLRITRKFAVFGFVGKDYKPYKRPWRFFNGHNFFPCSSNYRKDFDKKYHFIVCRK